MKKNNFNVALALLLSFFSAATFAQNNGSFVLGSGTITSDASGIGINVDSGVANGSTAVAIQHFDSINIAQNQTLSVQNNTGSNLRNFISADGSIYIAGNVRAAGGNPMSLSVIGAGGVVITDTANISAPGAFIAASGTLTNDSVTPDVTINLNSAGVAVNPAATIDAGSSAVGESSASYVASDSGAYLPFVAGNTFGDLDNSVTVNAAGHTMQADGVVSNYGAMTVNNSPEVTLNNLNLMNSAIAGLASEQFITDNNTTVHINNAVQYGAASQIYAGNFVLGGTNNGFLKLKTLNSDSVVDFGGATNNGSISIEGVNDSVSLTGAIGIYTS